MLSSHIKRFEESLFMSAIFSLIFWAIIIYAFIQWRRNVKAGIKMPIKTKLTLIGVAFLSLILFGITNPVQNTSKSSSTVEETTKNEPKSRSSVKKETVATSSSAPSSSSSHKSTNPTKSDLKDLNNWFKNEYTDEQTAAYQADGNEYFGTPEYIKAMVFKGFTVESGELTAVINNNQLKAENLTQKEVANFAFNVILPDYKGKLPKFKNTNDDGSLKDDVLKNPQYYSTLE